MLAPNTILRERYRIIQPLGRGGMGAVYQAMDDGANRIVAVKEAFAATDELRGAFRREAELLGSLRHPALPFVIEHFREGDGLFLVMQHIPGNNLREVLAMREQPFAVADVLTWADHLLDVLEELHSSQPPIIHRDIKPANLKLTPKGEIFLLDFGLAKGFADDMSTLKEGESLPSLHGATKHYAPLEQIQGTGTDPRSDLYSLGVTLWTLLTNLRPPDALTRLADQGEGKPDPLLPAHKLNPSVPQTISEILQQATAIYRHQRPDTAADMRRALGEVARELGRLGDEARLQPIERLGEEWPGLQPGMSVPVEGIGLAPTWRDNSVIEGATVTADLSESPHAVDSGMESTAPPRVVPSVNVVSNGDTEPPARQPDNSSLIQEAHDEIPPRALSPVTTSARRNKGGMKARQTALSVVTLIVIALGIIWWLFVTGGDEGRVVNPGQQQIAQKDNRAASVDLVKVTPNTVSEAPPSTTSERGDPVPPQGMVYVPGGTFIMGRDNGDDAEGPTHEATVDPFFIDMYEVTNEAYAKFIAARKWPPPPTWKGKTFPPGSARQPVTGVKWNDAKAYADWAGKRLPTEAEWEFAAGGLRGLRYPWGNEWRAGAANVNAPSRGVADVGTFRGASPFGAFDIVGNAWEWTATPMHAYPGGRLPLDLPKGDLKVIRGGSYESDKDHATTTYRTGWPASGASTYSQTGFRCAEDLKDQFIQRKGS